MNKAKSSNTAASPLRRKLQWAGGILIIVLILNFGYQAWSRYYHNKQYLTSIKSCSIQQNACTVVMKNKAAAMLTINPHPFKPGQQVQASATLKNLQALHVYLLTFEIGKSDPHVKPIELTLDENDQYSTYLNVPMATSSEKKWVIMLIIQTKEENYAVPFRFEL